MERHPGNIGCCRLVGKDEIRDCQGCSGRTGSRHHGDEITYNIHCEEAVVLHSSVRVVPLLGHIGVGVGCQRNSFEWDLNGNLVLKEDREPQSNGDYSQSPTPELH